MPFVLIVMCATVGVARDAAADDEPEGDEDGEFVAVPKWSVALSFSGHGTRIAGQSETGVGPGLELALGLDRWQYFVEGGFATAGMTRPNAAPGANDRIGGWMTRGGLGARWTARQFRPSRGGGIELFLLSLVGVQRFTLDDNSRVVRPELALGFGMQGRVFRRPRFAFRLDARLLFTPNDDEEQAVVACRGGGCMTAGAAGTGFMGGVALAW